MSSVSPQNLEMPRFRTLSLLALALSCAMSSHAGITLETHDGDPVRHELLPERRPQPEACAKTTEGQVSALLVGVDHYGPEIPGLAGSVNDARLLAEVLKRRGADVTEADNAPRAAVVDDLMALADKSRCGDTAFVYFGGQSAGYTAAEEQFLLSDATNPFLKDRSERYQLRRLEGSPAGRLRRMWPGTIDSNEMLDYFDRLRDNGINIVFIVDATDARKFAGRMGNAFSTWRGLQTDAQPETVYQARKAAYFGIYSGAEEIELSLPLGDKTGAVHGLLSWAMAATISEPETSTFSKFSSTVVTNLTRTAAALGRVRQALVPTFEASNPNRSPFATGLPAAGVGESGLRGTDMRRIEITTPALQRGAVRVGLGALLIEGRVMSATPPRAIEANGVVGKVNADGSFQIKLPVSSGETRVMLAAWWGDTDFVPRTFTLISEGGERVVQQGRQYALLIANENYKDPAFQHLATPIADSHALSQLLERRFGFSTNAQVGNSNISLVLDNAGRDRMLHVLSELRGVLKAEDSLLIYYAGHGVYEKETDRAYWLPVDAMNDEPEDWVSDQDVSSAILRLTARHVLIVADSCYSGAFHVRGNNDEIDRESMNRLQYLDEVSVRASRNLLTSGANEPVADGGGHGHSVFAQALLNGLSRETKPFTAGELFEEQIRAVVGGTSKQVPQYFPMKDGHEGGEFIFVPLTVPR